jgi:tryptophan synthase beta subunit
LRLLAIVDGGDHAVGFFSSFVTLVLWDLDALFLEVLAREAGDLGVLTGGSAADLDDGDVDADVGRTGKSMPIAPEPTTSSAFGIASGTIASR